VVLQHNRIQPARHLSSSSLQYCLRKTGESKLKSIFSSLLFTLIFVVINRNSYFIRMQGFFTFISEKTFPWEGKYQLLTLKKNYEKKDKKWRNMKKKRKHRRISESKMVK
jgi:hypothetical protein